jgi:hypothetical protein
MVNICSVVQIHTLKGHQIGETVTDFLKIRTLLQAKLIGSHGTPACPLIQSEFSGSAGHAVKLQEFGEYPPAVAFMLPKPFSKRAPRC